MDKPLIDLSQFLAPEDRERVKAQMKAKPAAEPQLPYRHIWCYQCSGTGKYREIRTHTMPLTEKAEELLQDMHAVLPKQAIISDEQVKCAHCDGTGHHYVADEPRERSYVLFWTDITCKCGAKYDSPAYANSFLARTDMYAPIVSEGRVRSWRFSRTVYVPAEQIDPKLPFKIEHIETEIPVCKKCVREQMIICLPHLKEVV